MERHRATPLWKCSVSGKEYDTAFTKRSTKEHGVLVERSSTSSPPCLMPIAAILQEEFTNLPGDIYYRITGLRSVVRRR
jgi:hypothetical protein